jgi:transcriptional regulator of heat shock response
MCDRVHASVLATGKAVADGRLTQSTNGFEAQVNKRLIEEQEKARAAEESQLRKECGESIEVRRAEYVRLMSLRQYWDASLSLRRCSELLDDQALKGLVADAEKKQYVMEIEAKSSSTEVRNQAIEALLRDYPELGRKYEKLLKK